jgi:hypothetical protein
MIDELNVKFQTELAPVCDNADDGSEDEDELDLTVAHADKRFIIVGGSHAGRLADCLDDLKLDVVDLSVPGWTLTEAKAERMAVQLHDVLNEGNTKKQVVIFQLFDNDIFRGRREDGKIVPAYKCDSDGRYHIEGELHVCDRNAVKELFNIASIVLRAGGESDKVLLSPVLRYMKKKCCDAEGHIVNKKAKSYLADMGVALNGVADWLGELAFRKRIRSYKILNPIALLGDTEEDDLFKVAKRIAKFWGSDPKHMKAKGYKQLAQSLAGQLVDLVFSRTYSQAQGSTTVGS